MSRDRSLAAIDVGFATERKALALDQFFAEMVVVKAGVGAARQLDDPLAHGVRQAVGAGPAAVDPEPPPRLRAFASSSA